jgi:hypothetical protein
MHVQGVRPFSCILSRGHDEAEEQNRATLAFFSLVGNNSVGTAVGNNSVGTAHAHCLPIRDYALADFPGCDFPAAGPGRLPEFVRTSFA